MTVASLGLEIRSAPAAKGATDLDRLTAAATRAQTAATRLAAANDNMAAASTRMSAATRKVIADLEFERAQLKRTAVDRAIHNNLRQAGVALATAEGRAIANVTRALHAEEAALARRNRVSSGVASGLGGFIGLAGGVLITQFAARSVKAASDVEEMMNLLNVTFGEAKAGVEDWAETTADVMGRSRFDLLRFAGDFATFLKPLGTAPDMIVPMSQALGELTVDIASFRNLAEADVFTKLMSGLAGETEAVRRLGIDLSAAAIEQELLRQGIDKTSAEATQAEKVMARYAIIMRQTTDSQGDAARTAGAFENRAKALSAEIRDLQVEVGQELMPVARGLLEMTIAITKAMGNESYGLVGGIREAKDQIAPFITLIGDISGPLGTVAEVFDGLTGQTSAVEGFFDRVKDAAFRTLSPIKAMADAITVIRNFASRGGGAAPAELPGLSFEGMRSDLGLGAAPIGAGAPGGGDAAKSYQEIIQGAQQHIALLETERQGYLLTSEAAAALRFEQELMLQAANDGIELSPIQVEQLGSYAAAMARAEEATIAVRDATQALETPWMRYEQQLGRINLAHRLNAISAQQAAQLQIKAGAELAATYLDVAGQITGALSGAFQENKAFAIANAVVNTAAGITKAFADPKLLFPLDFAVAASIAAAGAAQIATISSASPGSGKKPSVRGGGGSVSGGSSADRFRSQERDDPRRLGGEGEQAAPVAQSRSVHIVLEGRGYSREEVLELIEQMDKAFGDGATAPHITASAA